MAFRRSEVMSDKKIVVPEGGLRAAQRALNIRLRNKPQDLIYTTESSAELILEAFVRWLSENPIVPTLEQTENMRHLFHITDKPLSVYQNVAVEWQRRMFLAPKPELLPCPFCACPGDKLSVKRNEVGGIHQITCTHCYMAFYPSQQLDQCDFAKEWNRRNEQHENCRACGQQSREPK
jgi:hypothetical protein